MTYKVPAGNIDALRVKIADLNKQVARIRRRGYEAEDITLTVDGPHRQPREGRPDLVFFSVTVEGGRPRIAGWEFVATLQHTPDGNILRTVPGTDADLAAYRDSAPDCDHCHVRRQRTDTFVVRDTAGALRQVGRSCLADFLGGKDPASVVAYAELLAAAHELAGWSDSDGFVGGRQIIALEQYLPFVAAQMRQNGWVSRTKARDVFPPTLSTADAAWSLGAFPSPSTREEDQICPTDEDVALAARALSWVTEHLADATSDYEHNLRVVVLGEYVDFRKEGIAASLISYYQRQIGEEVARKARAATSAHVGEVGKRGTFPGLTVEKITDIDGQYGVTHLHTFRDSAGNVLKWFASNACLEVGATYDVLGTVKAHDEYKGQKQTLLTRCKTEIVRCAA